MRRAMFRTAVIGLTAVILTGGTMSAAHAADGAPAATPVVALAGMADCPLGDVCLWGDANYAGSAYFTPYDDSNYASLANNFGGCKNNDFNDCASSVYNHGRYCTVWMWTNSSYMGRAHSLGKGDAVGNFASSSSGYRDPAFNDSVSSHHWCNPKP